MKTSNNSVGEPAVLPPEMKRLVLWLVKGFATEPVVLHPAETELTMKTTGIASGPCRYAHVVFAAIYL